jgi:hypothetical protein
MAVKPDWKKGYTAGLKYWLILMVSFFLLRYDPPLCIALGAVGGAAVSIIASWWNAREDDVPEKQREKSLLEDRAVMEAPTARVRFRRYGSTGLRQRLQVATTRRLSWLLRKNKK